MTSPVDNYSITEYRNLGGSDTLKLGELTSTDIYIGEYKEFLSPFFRAQIVSFFHWEKSVGLSLTAEKYFLNFNPLNLKIGVPFTFKGKDDETKASFEFQVKGNDVLHNVLTDVPLGKKISLGISVGVPLTSKIY